MAYEGLERDVGVELVECTVATQVPRFAHQGPHGDNSGRYERFEFCDGTTAAVVLFATDRQDRISCCSSIRIGTLEIGDNASA